MVRRVGRTLLSVPWWVWALTVLALVLRLAPALYGLPYELDPDEQYFVDGAWRMLEGGAFDPDWYSVPAATLMDTLALAFIAYGEIGAFLGLLDAPAAAGDAYRADVSHFFIIGRAVSAVSGAILVPVTYATAREFHVSAHWAGVSAAVIALSWPMIQYSSMVRMDMLLVLFLLLIVLVMVRTLRRPAGWKFVLSGALLGLAVTSKYPGLLGVVPILGANVMLTVERRVTPRRGLLWLGAAAVSSIAVAMLIGPYLFADLRETLAWIMIEARPTHLGATGGGLVHDMWRYLSEALPAALGAVGTILGVAGLVAMLWWRRTRLASLTFWAFLLFISAMSLWWLRWALPLVPLAAIGAVVLIDRLQRRLRARRPGRWMAVVSALITALLILPLLPATISGLWAHGTNDDVRLTAIDWVHQNVPDGSTLLIDSYTTQVSSDRYDIVIAKEGELVDWSAFSGKTRPDGYFGKIAENWQERTPDELLDAIERRGVEYVVLSDLWIDLYRAGAADYPGAAALYDTLLGTFTEVSSFGREHGALGAPVRVLRVDLETDP